MTAKLLRAVRDVEAKVDDKLSAMKREMESADDRKMRLDSKPTFKKRGHEKQHQFNEQVRDKMDAAAAALEQTPPAMEKARTSLQEGEKLINICQKNILIVDRSEHGWATVTEYEEDELADNSDDEKRLFRTEARAGRKKKSTKDAKKKGGSAKKPYKSSQWSSPAPWSGERAQSGGATAFSPAAGMQWLVPQFANQGSRLPSIPTSSQLGYCGKMGHYRKACPLLQSGSSAKST
jgi:exonuclease VII small subunit